MFQEVYYDSLVARAGCASVLQPTEPRPPGATARGWVAIALDPRNLEFILSRVLGAWGADYYFTLLIVSPNSGFEHTMD